MRTPLVQSGKPDSPPVLPGFEHIGRFWDNAHALWAARLLPGEFYVTRNDEMITTVLGSCISACVRDPSTGVGGMNHFMLPVATSGDSAWNKLGLETRFGVAAMEQTINEVLKLGARREDLEFKLFGGGKIIEAMDTNDVGNRNIEFVRLFMIREGFKAAASDLGGPWPRKVNFFPKTGRVMIKRLRGMETRLVAERERQLSRTPPPQSKPGSIELF